MPLSITLNSGTVLTLTADQQTALTAFLAHPSNQIPSWDEVTEVTTMVPRWANADAWVVYHWGKLMDAVLGLCPPASVIALNEEIAALRASRIAANAFTATEPE